MARPRIITLPVLFPRLRAPGASPATRDRAIRDRSDVASQPAPSAPRGVGRPGRDRWVRRLDRRRGPRSAEHRLAGLDDRASPGGAAQHDLRRATEQLRRVPLQRRAGVRAEPLQRPDQREPAARTGHPLRPARGAAASPTVGSHRHAGRLPPPAGIRSGDLARSSPAADRCRSAVAEPADHRPCERRALDAQRSGEQHRRRDHTTQRGSKLAEHHAPRRSGPRSRRWASAWSWRRS